MYGSTSPHPRETNGLHIKTYTGTNTRWEVKREGNVKTTKYYNETVKTMERCLDTCVATAFG